jgi:hypothetical protein
VVVPASLANTTLHPCLHHLLRSYGGEGAQWTGMIGRSLRWLLLLLWGAAAVGYDFSW